MGTSAVAAYLINALHLGQNDGAVLQREHSQVSAVQFLTLSFLISLICYLPQWNCSFGAGDRHTDFQRML